MTIKFDKTAKIAMGVGAAIVLGGVGAVAAYKASVHNQNCISYENQLSERLSEGVVIIDKLHSMMVQINANPFTAFVYMGEVGKVGTEANTLKSSVNNLRYAYDNTCGADRVNKFLDRKDVKDRADYVSRVSARIQSF
jgi:hypothetical protein